MSRYWGVQPTLEPLERIEHLAHNVATAAAHIASYKDKTSKSTAEATLAFLLQRADQPDPDEDAVDQAEMMAEAMFIIDLPLTSLIPLRPSPVTKPIDHTPGRGY